MSIVFLLIPLGLLLLGLAVWAFVWAVDHDQFEDLDRPARAILFDDDLDASERSPEPPQSASDREA